MLDEIKEFMASIFGEDEILGSAQFWIVSIIGAVVLTVVFTLWGTGSYLGGESGQGFSLGIPTMFFSYACVLIVAYVIVMRDMDK